MKGNIMMRLIALMILIPAALAHFTGQIDLTEPTWLWLSIFAGLNALQSSFTGLCPACKFFDCNSGNCAIPASKSTQSENECCSGENAKSESKCCSPTSNSSECCSSTEKPKKSACCTPEKTSDSSCCSGSDKTESTDEKSCGDNTECLEIKVLGADKEKSETTAILIATTAKEMDILCCITKVEEATEIAAMGFDATSGVAIDGQVVYVGEAPTKTQITEWLQKTSTDDSPSGCCGSCS
ncbi:MAG: hypothetical protein ISEC1_P1485 [Thiomicrorhabdus sp.]|nr:MAG: hypothetical protein ISEC1_P1485 [Thiomicrorhabdus sp.]